MSASDTNTNSIAHLCKIGDKQKFRRKYNKKFSEFRFSETVGISKQVDGLARIVDDFFPEEIQIKTYEYDANGMKTRKISYTQQLKGAFCLVKIF